MTFKVFGMVGQIVNVSILRCVSDVSLALTPSALRNGYLEISNELDLHGQALQWFLAQPDKQVQLVVSGSVFRASKVTSDIRTKIKFLSSLVSYLDINDSETEAAINEPRDLFTRLDGTDDHEPPTGQESGYSRTV